jgi:hypothetical protein
MDRQDREIFDGKALHFSPGQTEQKKNIKEHSRKWPHGPSQQRVTGRILDTNESAECI